MTELTLESLAARVAELERKQAAPAVSPTNPAWMALVGSMEDNEFTRDMINEMEATREADQRAAREGLSRDGE